MSIYVSASGLNDYISCNRKSYYRIFKPVEPVKSIEAIKGTIVHQAIERYWNNLDDATEFVTNQCNEYNFSERDFSEVYGLTRVFFDNFYQYVEENDLIEHNFRIKLQDGVFLVGVFDRVSNGKVFDWKTGKKVPHSLSDNIQFILYNYAYKRVFNSTPVGLYFASLREERLVMYKEDEFVTSVVFDEIIPNYIRDVSNKNFRRTGIFNNACFRCDWKEHCLSGK